jgi:hypothetical protein
LTTNEIEWLVSACDLLGKGSDAVTERALMVVLGTLAAILTTGYIRPPQRWARLFYALYIPAWFCLFLSISRGDEVARRLLAAHISPNAIIVGEIGTAINAAYAGQLWYFRNAIGWLMAWLIGYLAWWIWDGRASKKSEEEDT